MSDVSGLLKELAGAGDRGDKIKVAIDRAAKSAGLPYWRTFDLWYRKAVANEAERQAIITALVEKRIADERNELHNLKIRIARMELRLNQAESALARAASDQDVLAVSRAFGIIA